MAAVVAAELVDFLNASPTAFHAVDEAKRRLKKVGFEQVSEREDWNLELGKKYFFTRNHSTIVAFAIGKRYVAGNGFHIIATAAVAKEALEGHCIYDGGYCKLHLSYSRHTDLNVKAHSDKSRDYTITDAGILSVPQTSASGWPSVPQPASLVYNTPAIPDGVWDANQQGIRPGGYNHPQVHGAYSGGQTYGTSAVPPYSVSGTIPSSSAALIQASQQMPPYGIQPGARQAPSAGQPPLYF